MDLNTDVGDAYLTSKDILDKTGISRATLNNYIARGLLPKPIVARPKISGKGPRQIGYFAPATLDCVEQILAWKQGGVSMEEIGLRLAANNPAPARGQRDARPQTADAMGPAATTDGPPVKDKAAGLTLTIDKLPHMAYMVNHKFEVLWLNDEARNGLPGLSNSLPASTEGRSIFRLLMAQSSDLTPSETAMLRVNLALAKERMRLEGIATPLRGMSVSRLKTLEQMYSEVEALPTNVVNELPLRLTTGEGRSLDHTAYATYFREGILIVIARCDSNPDELMRLLGRRDMVIRSLLKHRLPVLTELAVLMCDLQDSSKICSELPPDEYFELVNKIWSTAGDIFRKYYGTYGKHVGDGLVYYFFPQPDSNYVMNSAVCAQEIKTAIARLSKEWQLRKNWGNEICLNIGLDEGQEWLGTFHTATSVEFVVLGETITRTTHLSDMARMGQIWVTKKFMSKLSIAERDRIEFGVDRIASNGQRGFVQSSYSRVDNVVYVGTGRYAKLQDIAGLAVTEIRHVKSAQP